jgi:hypothetical protein
MAVVCALLLSARRNIDYQEVGMKRHVLFGTMLSAALAVGLSAQTGSAGSQTPGQQSQQSQNQQQVTVTGCLMEGAGTMAGASGGTATATGSGTSTGTGTSGTSGTQTGTQRSGSMDAKFHLTNAQVTPSDKTATSGTGTSGTGTSGTASGTSGTTSEMKVQLVGGDNQDLQRYVNSRVEVRGTLMTNQDRNRAGAGTGTATGTGTGTGTGTATGGTSSNRQGGDQMAQRVRVTSVRQIATSCTGN